jgi:hypothetical protein
LLNIRFLEIVVFVKVIDFQLSKTILFNFFALKFHFISTSLCVEFACCLSRSITVVFAVKYCIEFCSLYLLMFWVLIFVEFLSTIPNVCSGQAFVGVNDVSYSLEHSNSNETELSKRKAKSNDESGIVSSLIALVS